MRPLGIALSALLSLAGPGIIAQEPPLLSLHGSHFVSVQSLDLKTLLPEPPAPGSLAAEADLMAVLQAQAWRSPEQMQLAQRVDKGTAWDFTALPKGCEAKALPLTEKLFKHLGDDLWNLAYATKSLYERPRPPRADARVKPCVPLSSSGSYPSGHTFRLYVWAGVWSELFPELRTQFQTQAQTDAWGRVLGGVHFPTDLVGGERMAQRFLKALLASPDFQKELEASKKEVAGIALKKAS